MTVWKLIRILLRHALHGRGRDEVFVSIIWDLPESSGMVTGEVSGFDWTDDRDAFCIIDAVNKDPAIDVWFPAAGRPGPPAWSDFIDPGEGLLT